MKENARIRFQPHSCVVCGKVHDPIILDAEKYYAWQNGECIQNAFPEMSEDQQEILISGTCPECWDVLFPPEEKDEEVELESSDPNEDIVTEESERKRCDCMKAALEIDGVREDYKWDQKELEQREKDLIAIEQQEEDERQKELDEWYESIEEQNEFYCTDPFYPFFPSFGNIFS